MGGVSNQGRGASGSGARGEMLEWGSVKGSGEGVRESRVNRERKGRKFEEGVGREGVWDGG